MNLKENYVCGIIYLLVLIGFAKDYPFKKSINCGLDFYANFY